MGIQEKMARAAESGWLVDSLSEEERKTARHIADIAASIQWKRRLLGYTQTDLAQKLSVSQAMISRWENGEENFTVSTLSKISSALDMKFRNPFIEEKAV
jgi:ribosome-binding protein aMBF1 (putative translation factor)